ncbi:MAG: universal stress protein [Thiomicrorhabdus sp.]|nr:universal stress protein [Thiomicrorhabdus sp.]
MENYQRILVATDFSEQSMMALMKATTLAERFNAKLELLHVIEIPIYPVLEDVAVMGMPVLWDEELAKNIQNNADAQLKKVAHQFDIAHFMSATGNPSDEIITLAKVNNIDLIVMGFHGLSGIKKLIGSTTHSVINDAPCDVLAIKQQSE